MTPSSRIYTLSPLQYLERSQHRRSSTYRTSSGRTLVLESQTPCSECECQLQVPSDLDINRDRPLLNTVAPHNRHVVISTGRSDWPSRIENEEVKPTPITMISNSSFPPPPSHQAYEETIELHNTASASLFLFPHFLHFPYVLNTAIHCNHLVETYLDGTATTVSNSFAPHSFTQPRPITKPTILICSHGSRDRRCGILGPLLHQEFVKQASNGNLDIESGMISHVGGHAFAGNVIVYVPPGYCIKDDSKRGDVSKISPLAGMGIWYGRVEPKHVGGIIEETISKGNVLEELWRGGLDARKSNESWKVRVNGAEVMRV
ncbi:MAG: hypothetical protein Q9186_001137 [Xanthomendoza sp. 1 TL-2023]